MGVKSNETAYKHREVSVRLVTCSHAACGCMASPGWLRISVVVKYAH